jgi:hypothetical protein
MFNLCAPAIIYLIFSITQILIDTYKAMYNTAIIKIMVTVMVTLLLNILCEQGLGVVSWIIVFIPFILMTVIVSMVLYIFGLNATTGTVSSSCSNGENCINGVSQDSSGNIIVYDPYYNPRIKPVHYNSPNVIVPNPNSYPQPTNANTARIATNNNLYYFPSGSSSPAYRSGY